MHIAAEYPVEKNPFIQKTRSTRQRGERSDPPRSLSAGNRKSTDTKTEAPQNTNIFKNETFGIKRVFAIEKRGGDVRAERARLFEPPHDQSRHPQRHTVQGTTFFTLSQVTRGGSIKNSISGNVCVMGAFSMSGGFQNGTGKGRGRAMPLTPSEKACSGFLQLPFTGKAGIGVF